ncbi:MAG: CPBP family glutamic-type intramembrane protease [Puniceicoccaceae bacterium]
MSDSPLLILLVFAGALYLAKLWRDDLLSLKAGEPNPKALPGATPATGIALGIAAIGAIILVLLETGGELALGVSSEQTDISVIFLFAMIGAGILEEVIFRGYLVITKKGTAFLVGSIIAFSLIFALLHFQYYATLDETEEGRALTLTLDSKSGWSLLLLFLNSLWFYTVRFFKWNPQQSLLPCFVAHITSNVAVFVIKLLQGHVTSLY